MRRLMGVLLSVLAVSTAAQAESPRSRVADPQVSHPEIAHPEVAQAAEGWATYRNARFGTTIDYPANLFEMLPPPDNHDGRSFAARGGTAGFILFAGFNVFDETIDGLLAADLSLGGYDTLTYSRQGQGPAGDQWYVLSGLREGDIFYRKVILTGDSAVIHTFEISYPAAEKPTFDPVTARMAESMNTGA